jgi:hypothetical protein
MRSATRTVLTTGTMLIGVGAAAAQAPVPRPAVLITEMPSGSVATPARSPVAVIERLMSFDANSDLRISRDELPERMQELVARGDKNADAALDSDEIRALATAASSGRTRVSFRSEPPEGLPGVVKDLRLPPTKRERALAIVNKPPDVNDPSSSVYKQMRALLDDEEYENFVAAATRLSRSPQIRNGVVGGVIR